MTMYRSYKIQLMPSHRTSIFFVAPTIIVKKSVGSFSFPRKPQLTNEAFLIMGYNYAWLLSASYVDLSLTNAIFQLSVVRSPRSVVLLQHGDTDHMCGDCFKNHYI